MSKNDSIFDDRRQFRRFPGNVDVRFRHLDVSDIPKASPAARIRDGVTQNLSTTGLFLVTTTPIDQGAMLEILFTMPNGREAKVLGRVMWHSKSSSDPGYGIEVFKTTDDEYAEMVSRAKRGEWLRTGPGL